MPVSTYIALDRKIAGVRERVFLRVRRVGG